VIEAEAAALACDWMAGLNAVSWSMLDSEDVVKVDMRLKKKSPWKEGGARGVMIK
jgi:hypothetical protein